jgi:hypothetical protein
LVNVELSYGDPDTVSHFAKMSLPASSLQLSVFAPHSSVIRRPGEQGVVARAAREPAAAAHGVDARDWFHGGCVVAKQRVVSVSPVDRVVPCCRGEIGRAVADEEHFVCVAALDRVVTRACCRSAKDVRVVIADRYDSTVVAEVDDVVVAVPVRVAGKGIAVTDVLPMPASPWRVSTDGSVTTRSRNVSIRASSVSRPANPA